MSVVSERTPALAALFIIATWSSGAGQQLTMQNSQLSVTAGLEKGTYEIRAQGASRPVLRSGVAVEVDHHWLKSGDFPQSKTTQSPFTTTLGKGQMLTTTYSGLADRPSLILAIRLYDELPFGEAEVKVQNSTQKPLTVQAIRSVEAVGLPRVDLGGREDAARVLSDSFSEDRPVLRIYDLGKASFFQGLDDFGKAYSDEHFAVGSQLIYNRDSRQSLFLGALTSERWLTELRLKVARLSSEAVGFASYTVDCTGTTEVEKNESLRDVPPENQIELSLSVPAGQGLGSERLLFSTGSDYIRQLQVYGETIKRLHHARVASEAPTGWWSWIPYYAGVTAGLTLTNAQSLAEHLEKYGYRYILIDEGYQYARGEYTTTNAVQFPEGMLKLTQQVANLGLKLGVWTAPFEVSERAWVYQHHPEWLVRNTEGKPLRIRQPSIEPLHVLDSTHPGAQDYLRQTYRTLAREWGLRYIKLDFMDDTAVEGFYHQPGTTALQAQRIGLQVIRQAVGDDVLIDKDGSPMLNPVGIVDDGRTSLDTAHNYKITKAAAVGLAARFYMHRNFFISDPDAFSVLSESPLGSNLGRAAPPVSLDEAESAIVMAAVSGSMFEIGDDLTLLTEEPERRALVQNRDLLQMIELNQAAVPVDLMSYASEDEQPSIFVLHEDARKTMLAVFNWTDAPRSHTVRRSDLGLPTGRALEALDVLHSDRPVAVSDETLEFRDLPPHSVRVIRIVDTAIAAKAPTLTLNAPTSAAVAKPFTATAAVDPQGVPALAYHWEFGDGTSVDGARVTHTFTRAGTFTVQVSAEGVDGLAAKATASVKATGILDPRLHFKENQRYTESAGK